MNTFPISGFSKLYDARLEAFESWWHPDSHGIRVGFLRLETSQAIAIEPISDWHISLGCAGDSFMNFSAFTPQADGMLLGQRFGDVRVLAI